MAMPRDDSITPRDLIGKLDALRVECSKCDRRGRYRVARLAETIGLDGKLTDWFYALTKDCPRKHTPGLADPLRRAYPGPVEGCLMAKAPTPADIAADLAVPERVLLFCLASGTDWAQASVTHAAVRHMIVRGAPVITRALASCSRRRGAKRSPL
jgi:hypothetical protein